MQTFAYKGFDTAGRACRGLVEALSEKQARERLAADGILAEKLSAAGHSFRRRGRFNAVVRATMYRSMASLVEAGMPVVNAIEFLINSPDLGRWHGVLATLRDRVREGHSLASSLQEASGDVGPFEMSVVEAAEKSSALGMMLERLGRFLEDRERLRERVQSALIYPLIVFTAGLCVAMLMLGLLLPVVRRILGETSGELPAVTRTMLAMGSAVSTWGIPVAAVLGTVVLVLAWRWRRDHAFRCAVSRFLYRLPFVSRGRTLLTNVRFSHTFGMLLEAGISVLEALPLAARATGDPWVVEHVTRAAEQVRHGARVSEALRGVPPLAGTLPGWIQVGEVGGQLPELMGRAASDFEWKWDRFVARVLALLEPLLILLIGGFVLFVTLSILLPVITLTRTIG